jgi:YVTN family beta-propeller protein
VIKTGTKNVVATVPVGQEPYEVAVNPKRKRAYVANQLTNPGTVSVINTSSNKVVATITTGAPPIGPPTGVAVTPDGKHVYVTNESTPTGTVAVIKAATNKVVATIPVVRP